MLEVNAIQRAFELAASGQFPTLADVRRQLRKEDYVNVTAHLGGVTIRRQLLKLIRNATG